jgi:hypothetical protein
LASAAWSSTVTAHRGSDVKYLKARSVIGIATAVKRDLSTGDEQSNIESSTPSAIASSAMRVPKTLERLRGLSPFAPCLIVCGAHAIHQALKRGILPERIEQRVALKHREAGKSGVDGPVQPPKAVVPVAKLRQGGPDTVRDVVIDIRPAKHLRDVCPSL